MRSGVRSPQRPFIGPVDSDCQRVFSFTTYGNRLARLVCLSIGVHLVSDCQRRCSLAPIWCKRWCKRGSVGSGHGGFGLLRSAPQRKRRQHVERPAHVEQLRIGVNLLRHIKAGTLNSGISDGRRAGISSLRWIASACRRTSSAASHCRRSSARSSRSMIAPRTKRTAKEVARYLARKTSTPYSAGLLPRRRRHRAATAPAAGDAPAARQGTCRLWRGRRHVFTLGYDITPMRSKREAQFFCRPENLLAGPRESADTLIVLS